LEVATPAKGTKQHVSEWLRRCGWLDINVYKVDATAHYATWKDCCTLADAYMYVFRVALIHTGRATYGKDGKYDKFSTPCLTKYSDASSRRLWAAMLDNSPDMNSSEKGGVQQLFESIDFRTYKRVPDSKIPKGYGDAYGKTRATDTPSNVLDEKTHIPVITKSDIRKVTEENYRKEKQEKGEKRKTNSDPNVSLDKIIPFSAESTTGAVGIVSIIQALVSGKKLKIEISLGE
jgi:hypothetical protein